MIMLLETFNSLLSKIQMWWLCILERCEKYVMFIKRFLMNLITLLLCRMF